LTFYSHLLPLEGGRIEEGVDGVTEKLVRKEELR